MAIHKMEFITQRSLNLEAITRAAHKKVAIREGRWDYATRYHLPTTSVAVWCNYGFDHAITKAKISVIVSDFPTYTDFAQFLTDTFPTFDISEAWIVAIELCIDVENTVEYFRHHIYIKRLRVRDRIQSNSDTLVFGALPKRMQVYDRAKKLRLPKGTILTRLEVQYHSTKCPMRRITDISKLLSFNPYENVFLFEVTSGESGIITRGIRGYVETVGMHDTIRNEIKSDKINKYLDDGYLKSLDRSYLVRMFHENISTFLQCKKSVILLQQKQEG